MLKNILIIDSAESKSKFLSYLFDEINQKGFTVSLITSSLSQNTRFKNNSWFTPLNKAVDPVRNKFLNGASNTNLTGFTKKTYLGPNLKNSLGSLIFTLIIGFLFLKFLFLLAYLKYKKNINYLICLNLNEKIIATLAAKTIGLKIIWLELPEIDYSQVNKFILGLYRLNSNWADLITFNNYTKIRLKNLMIKERRIKTILPGIRSNQFQDDIFNKLAKVNRKNLRRKYFTLGMITDLNQKQKMETVFQAVKICLGLIPNLQLIIIGDGRERKNLNWLAKKIEIDSLVWFVGEQEQLKKWLDSFDIFISLNETVKFDDLLHLLEAMAAGLPIIASRNIGLEDIIYENKTGSFIEVNNSEMLARQIIKLHQDKTMRIQLGENGLRRVNEYFTFDNMVNDFTASLK